MHPTNLSVLVGWYRPQVVLPLCNFEGVCFHFEACKCALILSVAKWLQRFICFSLPINGSWIMKLAPSLMSTRECSWSSARWGNERPPPIFDLNRLRKERRSNTTNLAIAANGFPHRDFIEARQEFMLRFSAAIRETLSTVNVFKRVAIKFECRRRLSFTSRHI